MRLVGTVNIPNEAKIKKGRKPALATLVFPVGAGVVAPRYTLDQFTKAKADGAKPAVVGTPANDATKAADTVVDWAKVAELALEYSTTLPEGLPKKAEIILESDGTLGDLRNALRGVDLLGDAKLRQAPT